MPNNLLEAFFDPFLSSAMLLSPKKDVQKYIYKPENLC
jgi:hypothetical protein